jgi:hypothetical protein
MEVSHMIFIKDIYSPHIYSDLLLEKNSSNLLYICMTHTISPQLTKRQEDFVKGTILGGSSIVKPPKGKNCYLSMRNKNIDWLWYKATELQNLASSTPITIERTNRWHSKCYPVFNEYHKMFYLGSMRNLILENLELLRDVTLAIWYGDCGCFKKNQVVFNTHIWKEDGTNVIVKYFKLLDYVPKIFKERGSFRIKLDKDSSQKFMRLISPHLPEWFLRKFT